MDARFDLAEIKRLTEKRETFSEDAGTDDHDHLISDEERLRVATAIQ